MIKSSRPSDDELKIGDGIGRQFFGGQNMGVYFRYGETGNEFSSVSTNDELQNQNRVVTSRSHYTEEVKKAFDLIQVDSIERVGGAGNKALMLLEGKSDLWMYA